jgi:hypothetical protein
MVAMKYLNFNDKIKELKKGAENGYCRICGNYRKLTVDHIPPKACGNNNRIQIICGNKKIISQNGLNCRTICEDCNNRLLGSNYDKILIKLYNEITSIISSGIVFGRVKINIDVKSLIRCLLGHMLSICVYDKEKTVQELLECKLDDKNTIYNTFRGFVLGEAELLNNFCCYYWYYPYNDIIINPYFLKADVITPPKIKELFGTLIKFFPIALYIIDMERSTAEMKWHTIDFNRNYLILDFKNKIRKDFPETPSTNEIILLSSGASFDVENSQL